MVSLSLFLVLLVCFGFHLLFDMSYTLFNVLLILCCYEHWSFHACVFYEVVLFSGLIFFSSNVLTSKFFACSIIYVAWGISVRHLFHSQISYIARIWYIYESRAIWELLVVFVRICIDLVLYSQLWVAFSNEWISFYWRRKRI
jgi:hypothetical protein